MADGRHIGFTKITCCAVVLSAVLTAGWLSYGKSDFRPTPYSSTPNEPIKMAFGTRDYVVENTPPANLYPTTLLRLPAGKGWNITMCPSLFVFPTTSRALTRVGRFTRSLHQMTSFRCFLCLLRVRIVFGTFWGRLLQKTAKKRPQRGNSSQNKNSEKSKLLYILIFAKFHSYA